MGDTEQALASYQNAVKQLGRGEEAADTMQEATDSIERLRRARLPPTCF